MIFIIKVFYCLRNKTNMSDCDTKTETSTLKNKINNKGELGDNMLVSWQLLFTFWVRWIIQNVDGVHGIVLDS